MLEALNNGVLAGYQVVDVKVHLTFGSYHDVDSSEQAFRMAAIFGFKEACRLADPVILSRSCRWRWKRRKITPAT